MLQAAAGAGFSVLRRWIELAEIGDPKGQVGLMLRNKARDLLPYEDIHSHNSIAIPELV